MEKNTSPELQAQVEKVLKLTGQMLDPETGVMSRIKSLEEKGLGSADYKEQIEKISADNAKAIDKINEIEQDLAKRQDEFEMKLSGAGRGASKDPFASFMKSVTEAELPTKAANAGSDLRMALRSGVKGSFGVDALFTKTVTSLAASAGDLQVPSYETQIRAPGEEPNTLLNFIPRTRTMSSLIYWVVEVLGSRTDGVAIASLDFTGTGQGSTAFGSSDFVFNQLSAETRDFGHTSKVHLNMLADASQLRGYIENRMRFMVLANLASQVLTGDNTGKNFNGLKEQATAYDTTLDNDLGVSGIQNLDVLRLAIHQCALTYFPATAIILHPNQFTGLELLKDSTERYMLVNPLSGNALRPWGLPVAPTTDQTDGDFTVGALNQVEIALRQDVEILIATENEDDFTKKLAAIRADGRFGLKVYEPTSIIDGDFTSAKA